MPKQKFLYVCLIFVSLIFINIVNGKNLFRDDFEGDTIGDPPKNFEEYKHAHNNAGFKIEVVKDPNGESGKVVHLFSYAYYIPKTADRDNWSDWVWEWDWMWSQKGFPGTAFRITGNDYYHISPRDSNTQVGFWYWNGAWNQRGDLAQYDFGLNTWNRFQVTAKGDEFTLKIKKRDDNTPFSKIKALLTVKDNTLKKGPVSVGGAVNQDNWIDNFVVGESENDLNMSVNVTDKLTSAWGAIKNTK